MSLEEYQEATARTRDRRMEWWRRARFGMFIHYGLYAQLARNEWVMALENIPREEYDALADSFAPKPHAPREWVKLAKEAGMNYAVMTTKHHEGFCLWDSEVSEYCAGKRGPKRDIVAEFVEACRAEGLRIGFYYSLMDWHHPDGWRCAFDPEARRRFLDYTKALVRELMTRYGTIDILWYDVSWPMTSHEGWETLDMNQMVRSLQPDIIINNRAKLPEDFGTPEERITASEGDWEACMTFNGLSWGYIDSRQAAPYSYNAQGIVKMLNSVCSRGGNLLLNIGPTADGSVPPEAVEPLQTVGSWLSRHGEAVYGELVRIGGGNTHGAGEFSASGNRAYFWCRIWPHDGELHLGGFMTKLLSVHLLATGREISFTQEGQRIHLYGLPAESPDTQVGVAVLSLEFDGPPRFINCSAYPQIHGGRDFSAWF
jgi:alpha-L-fucosidase